jgi:putative redox protein
MLRTQLNWQGGALFDGTGGSGGPAVRIQAGAGEGPRQGPSAKELVLLGLSACTGVDVTDILAKMRQNLEGLEIAAEAEVAEAHPRYLTRGVLRFAARGAGLDPDKVLRAVRLSLERYCGVAATLSGKMALRYAVTVNGVPVQEETAAAVP